eukprot:361630-Chlamydomonas_euryale.AAC.10
MPGPTLFRLGALLSACRHEAASIPFHCPANRESQGSGGQFPFTALPTGKARVAPSCGAQLAPPCIRTRGKSFICGVPAVPMPRLTGHCVAVPGRCGLAAELRTLSAARRAPAAGEAAAVLGPGPAFTDSSKHVISSSLLLKSVMSCSGLGCAACKARVRADKGFEWQRMHGSGCMAQAHGQGLCMAQAAWTRALHGTHPPIHPSMDAWVRALHGQPAA